MRNLSAFKIIGAIGAEQSVAPKVVPYFILKNMILKHQRIPINRKFSTISCVYMFLDTEISLKMNFPEPGQT